MLMDRRAFVVGGTALGLTVASAQDALASMPLAPDQRIKFDVFRNGSNIGHHTVDVTQTGDTTIADVEIALEVSVGPIVFFRYLHRNQEIWEGNQFVSFVAETDNDGEAFKIRAERQADGIFVSREHDEDFLIPDFSALPTTYWNPHTLSSNLMIDTQQGRLMEVSVKEGDWQQIDTKAGTVEAQRFDVAGGLNLSIWYDRAGVWSKLQFPLDGADFHYLKNA